MSDIKVTQDMVDAGKKAYEELFKQYSGHTKPTLGWVCEKIYIAMEKARKKEVSFRK